MKNPRAYQSYFGGKSGNGTYQTLINHIPPHRKRLSAFAGNDALTIHMKECEEIILMDLDSDVIGAWHDVIGDQFTGRIHAHVNDALYCLDWLKDHSVPISSLDIPPNNTFIFLDPPYLLNTRKSQKPVYKFEMTKQQHIELLDLITQREMQEYKIMICCYPNDLYHEYLGGWEHHDFYSTIRGGVALERIYMNYKLDGKLHDYRYVGGNFREREKFKRISTNLIKKLSGLPTELRNSIITDIMSSINELK